MRNERFAICDLRFASGCCADGEGGGKGRAGEEAKGRGRGGFVSSKKCGGTGGKSLIWEWWRGFGRFSVAWFLATDRALICTDFEEKRVRCCADDAETGRAEGARVADGCEEASMKISPFGFPVLVRFLDEFVR